MIKSKLLQEIQSIRKQLKTLENMVEILPGESPSEPAQTANKPSSDSYTGGQSTDMFIPKKKAPTPTNFQQATWSQSPSKTELIPGFTMDTSRWLGLIGVFCFILGSSFLIKLAVDVGWLTPIRQIGMAAIVGCSLIGFGLLKMQDEENAAYWSLLPGTGIAILYMTLFGGRLFYELYDLWVMFLCNAAITAGALYLFKKLNHTFFVLSAVIGTYICPMLIEIQHTLAMETIIFFLFWDVTFAVMAIKLNNRVMLLLTAYAALFVFAVPLLHSSQDWTNQEIYWIAGFEFVQFLIFFIATLVFSISKKSPMQALESWAYFPLLLFFYGMEYFLLQQVIPDQVAWVGVIFAGLVFGGLYLADQNLKDSKIASKEIIYSYLSIILFHSLYLNILSPFFQGIFCAALFAGWVFKSVNHESKAKLPAVVLMVGILMFMHNYAKILFPDFSKLDDMQVVLLNLTYAGLMYYVYFYFLKENANKKKEHGALVLILANIQAMTGLFRLSTEIANTQNIDTLGRFITSVFWGIYALAILFVGNKNKDRLLAKTALSIIFLSAAKVLVFDVSGASQIVRVLCFFTLGAVLYAAGLMYSKIEKWKA